MATGSLTVQATTLAGIVVTLGAPTATDGDAFVNNGHTMLIVDNASASPITLTINSVAQCSQGFDHDITATVAAGDRSFIGPFSMARYNDSNGKVKVICSAVTDVTVAAVKI